MGRQVVVIGPAYLDRVLRIDQPLTGDSAAPPLDQSIEGHWKFAKTHSVTLRDPAGGVIAITPPPDWPGPWGEVALECPIRPGSSGRLDIAAVSWQDDLGGMGAGFASALGGVLHSALGLESDPASRLIAEMLDRYGIEHDVIRVPDRPADWTLLISSGSCGDKLAIGFRGCHAAIDPGEIARRAQVPCDLMVVAGLPNPLARAALSTSGSTTRLFAPAMRNMTDARKPIRDFAGRVHILCCNRAEWEALEDPEAIAHQVPIVAVTDGPRGIELRFTAPGERSSRLAVPAFPRSRPPRDTNRAGEAFASAFVMALMERGWRGDARDVNADLVQEAAARGAAAAALELDLLEFGFPGPAEIDRALEAGIID